MYELVAHIGATPLRRALNSCPINIMNVFIKRFSYSRIVIVLRKNMLINLLLLAAENLMKANQSSGILTSGKLSNKDMNSTVPGSASSADVNNTESGPHKVKAYCCNLVAQCSQPYSKFYQQSTTYVETCMVCAVKPI